MITKLQDRVKNRPDGFYWVRWDEHDYIGNVVDWLIMEWDSRCGEWMLTGSDSILKENDIYLVDENIIKR